VSRIHVGIGNRGRWEVTLQAYRVDVGEVQKLGIVAAVRLVTCRAAGLFDGSVFVHPWTYQVRVALQACGGLLRDRRLQSRFKCAVRIVTCGALDRVIIDLVMNRGGELGLDAGVALITEDRLRRLQKLPFLSCMDGMAASATDVGRGVSRTREAWVLGGVAAQAA
jgi:hypothetical protein